MASLYSPLSICAILSILILCPMPTYGKFYIGRFKTVPIDAPVQEARNMPYILYPGEAGSEALMFNKRINRWRIQQRPEPYQSHPYKRFGNIEAPGAFGLTNNYGNDIYNGYTLVDDKKQVGYVIPPFTPGGRVHVAFQFWIPISIGGFFVTSRDLEAALRSTNPTAYLTTLFLHHLATNTSAADFFGNIEKSTIHDGVERFLSWVLPYYKDESSEDARNLNTDDNTDPQFGRNTKIMTEDSKSSDTIDLESDMQLDSTKLSNIDLESVMQDSTKSPTSNSQFGGKNGESTELQGKIRTKRYLEDLMARNVKYVQRRSATDEKIMKEKVQTKQYDQILRGKLKTDDKFLLGKMKTDEDIMSKKYDDEITEIMNGNKTDEYEESFGDLNEEMGIEYEKFMEPKTDQRNFEKEIKDEYEDTFKNMNENKSRVKRSSQGGWVTIGGRPKSNDDDDDDEIQITSPLLSQGSMGKPGGSILDDRLLWGTLNPLLHNSIHSLRPIDLRPELDFNSPIDYPSKPTSSRPSRPNSRPFISSIRPLPPTSTSRPTRPSNNPPFLTSFDDLATGGATGGTRGLNVMSRLSRLDYFFSNLHLEHEDCRRRVLCEVARDPDTFAPLSDMISSETRLPGKIHEVSRELLRFAEGARLLSYVEAVQVGQDRSQECDVFHYRCQVQAREVINIDILPIWREVVRWLTVKVLSQDSSPF